MYAANLYLNNPQNQECVMKATKPGKGKLIDYELRDRAVEMLKWEFLGVGC